MRTLDFDCDLEWAPKQWELLNFRAPPKPDGRPQIEFTGALGEYGGGKSAVALARMLAVIAENPRRGNHIPKTGLVGPTLGDLKKNALPILMSYVPREAIIQERLWGEWQSIEFSNGHMLFLYSARGALNGPTLAQLVIEEIQEKCYAGILDNLQGRVRDKKAVRPAFGASGIAEAGHVEDFWRDKEASNRMYRMLFPEENAINLAAGYVDEMKSSLPGSRERDADGWIVPKDVFYPKFATSRNLTVEPPLESLHGNVTHLGVDFGKHSAICFVQQWGGGLLVVHEICGEDMDAPALAAYVKRSPWRVGPGSTIAVDPSAPDEQLQHLRAACPGAEIVQHKSGFYKVEDNGIRAVDRAVLDMHHEVRLWVHPALRVDPSKRGSIAMFRGYSVRRPRDKVLEHMADAIRYIVSTLLPLPVAPDIVPIAPNADLDVAFGWDA